MSAPAAALPSRVVLEIAVASVADAQSAQAAGADRLELNSCLAQGGLTPSLGTLVEVRQATSLPVFAMLRPRPGGFCYDAAEFRGMLRDLEYLLANGADGVVFGILQADGSIDIERCQQLQRHAGGRALVFHRAFDLTLEPTAALAQLVNLGLTRVMTSGRQESALSGAEMIASILRQSAGRIEVLPAGGIRSQGARELVVRTGCNQIHAGPRTLCRVPNSGLSPRGESPDFLPGHEQHDRIDAHAVSQLRSVLDSFR
jgi:copper homeostasis protein